MPPAGRHAGRRSIATRSSSEDHPPALPLATGEAESRRHARDAAVCRVSDRPRVVVVVVSSASASASRAFSSSPLLRSEDVRNESRAAAARRPIGRGAGFPERLALDFVFAAATTSGALHVASARMRSASDDAVDGFARERRVA